MRIKGSQQLIDTPQWERVSRDTRSAWWRSGLAANRGEFAIVVVGFVAAHAIFLSRAFRTGSTVDPSLAGQLGDFVGGYVGALFTLVSIVLLYKTLRNQISNAQAQAFENRYFELLRLHRDNVSELELGDSKGRKVFVLMLRELRAAHRVVGELFREQNVLLSQRDTMQVAYYVLFFGTGPHSSRMLQRSLEGLPGDVVRALERRFSDDAAKNEAMVSRRLKYTPFEGHQSRLGHYYRHLYHTVRYVDSQAFLNGEQKYEYARHVRAQLSTHEQALLLINSLTPIGNGWWSLKLIETYRLVQNLPREFFDAASELEYGAMFKPGYFEWEETPIWRTAPANEAAGSADSESATTEQEPPIG